MTAADEVVAEGPREVLALHINFFQGIKSMIHIYNLEKLLALVFIKFQLDWLVLDSRKPSRELFSS